ncbi:MAG: D-aminoacyl-tRNA deacylase, partial [Caldisericaceae bacterium]
MRAVVQRVKKATVSVEGKIVSRIGEGLLVLVGIEKTDTEEIAKYISEKIINLRIFEDESGKMNLSVQEVKGSVLVVSQFTLASYVKKGNRPSFSDAMEENNARSLYEHIVSHIKNCGVPVFTGVFKAHMEIGLTND